MTPMGRLAWSDRDKAAMALSRIPLQRFPEPEDVAQTVMYLLSDEARMINGQVRVLEDSRRRT